VRTRSWTLAVVLFDEIELLDVAGPLEVFSCAGRQWNWRPFKALTVAEQAGRITTRGQLAIFAEHAFDTCATADFLLVPGGYGARRALDNANVLGFVKRIGESAERILAIGNGSLLLAKAGLSAGAELSVPKDAVEALAELDPTARAASEPPLRESGKLLSAAASGQAVTLALSLVSKTIGVKLAAQVAATLGLEFAEGPTKIDVV